MRNGKVLFLGFNQDYEKMELDSLVSSGINFDSIYLPSLLYSIIKRIKIVSEPIFFFIFKLFVNLKIKNISQYEIVIVMDNIDYVKYASQIDVKKIMLFRNKYKSTFDEYIDKFIVYSFDYEDCEKFNFIKYNQYCSGYNYLVKNRQKNINCTYDLSFVGLNKGRATIIDRIEKALSKYDVFILLPDRVARLRYFLEKLKILKSHRLSYEKYLKIILSSKVILELVKSGQHGESMRFIEACVSGKKIITNNYNLLKHELYTPNRVAVIDFNDENEMVQAFDKLISSNEEVVGKEDVLYKFSPQYFFMKLISDNLKL